jgi:hypothetical protein
MLDKKAYRHTHTHSEYVMLNVFIQDNYVNTDLVGRIVFVRAREDLPEVRYNILCCKA